ncbi:MAG: response regulator transcription factor [Patescibacteria group bacterium]
MSKILIVEDEESIREVMKKYLELAGFSVDEAGSGEVAMVKFNDTFDLVILDLNLPNRDGLEVCRNIRQKSKVPIIMVTARIEEPDELKGLTIGADDYIKKPFSPKVLVARVKARLRQPLVSVPRAGGLALDEEKMIARKGDQEIILTTTQFKILNALIRQPGKVFTRPALLEAIDGDGSSRQAMERTIDAHIKSLRKLIEDDSQNPKYILTVIGTGYKYNL